MNQSPENSRSIAYEAMLAVEMDDAYANLILPSLISKSNLSHRDARLCTELCYGTLRMQGFYDSIIEQVSSRHPQQIDLPLLVILRLGAHQLLSMRVPAHAAVDEMVQLARKKVSQSSTGFVNAVLRKILLHSSEEWVDILTSEINDEYERLAVAYSHPSWIVRAFSHSLELDGRKEELVQLLSAENINPQVTYIQLPQGEMAFPKGSIPTPFSPFGFYHDRVRSPLDLISPGNGLIRVQDEGSQLASLALSEADSIEDQEKWLDLCSGPGGKAALLASRALPRNTELIANEISPSRVNLVKQALKPFSNALVLDVDGRHLEESHAQTFDRVLVDAPCTGLGALRRRPEARWRKKPSDVAELTLLQEQLLHSAISVAKPGALIAYVTCSPHVAETRMIVNKALHKHKTLEEVDVAKILNQFSRQKINSPSLHKSVQLWPHIHGTDAMFISLMRLGQ